MTLAHDSDFVKLFLEIPHNIEHVLYFAQKNVNPGDKLVSCGVYACQHVFTINCRFAFKVKI